MASIDFTGAVELEDTLKRMELSLRKKAAQDAVKKAGNVVAIEYRKRIHRGDPEWTPNVRQLYRLISTKTKVYQNGKLFVAITGVRTDKQKGEGFYAHFVEFGFRHYAKFGTRASVPGKPALIHAQNRTLPEQIRQMRESLARSLAEAAG